MNTPMPLMLAGTLTGHLRRCRGCGWWTRWLSTRRLCRDCVLGWVCCPVHGRLEHAAGDHVRVSVAEVLLAIPDTRQVAT